MLHKVYNDEAEVARLTREHLDAGRTVLQLFQLGDTEQVHSIRVLDAIKPIPECGSVLSLGCGVGGMERHWHQHRDDLTFTLVNRSQAQLDLCLCTGRRVCADAQRWRDDQQHDLTVVAYVMGHCVPEMLLEAAKANTRKGGQVLVLDVFEGSVDFDAAFSYATVLKREMRGMGFIEVEQPHPWRLMPLIHRDYPWVPRHTTPAMWVRDV